MRRRPFYCPECDRTLSTETPRVTTAGRTICGDCAYRIEVNAEPVPVKKRKPGPDQLTLA